MMALFLTFLKAFAVGGLICCVGQALLMHTKLTSANTANCTSSEAPSQLAARPPTAPTANQMETRLTVRPSAASRATAAASQNNRDGVIENTLLSERGSLRGPGRCISGRPKQQRFCCFLL